jgi:hypothetical protein
MPTLADRECHEASVTDPYGRILGFLDRTLERNILHILSEINTIYVVYTLNKIKCGVPTNTEVKVPGSELHT